MNKIIASNDNSKITDFEKQKDQLSDVKYKNVKEFCDSLGDDSVSDLKNFVSWVENKFGNEKVKLANGQECSVWYYLLIYKEIKAFSWYSCMDWQLLELLKQDIEPTGWLTFFVCVSALFSVVIVGIPFFIILGEKLMARNWHNDKIVMMCYRYIPVYKRKSIDDCWSYLNNLSEFPKNNLKLDNDFNFNK